MFNITTLQQLSGFLQGRLSRFTSTEILSAINSLSAIPYHPYERAKYNLFGEGHKFTTINEVETPLDFDPTTYMYAVTAIGAKHSYATLSALSAWNEHTNTGTVNLTAQIEVDTELGRKNIEFCELVKSISLDDINNKPFEIAQKIASFYIKQHS